MWKRILSVLTALATLLWLAACSGVEALDAEQTIEVPAGMRISVTLDERLDSGENYVGDTFSMTVAEEVVVNEQTAIPVGTVVSGVVSDVESAGRPNKGGKLSIEPRQLTVRGESIPLKGDIVSFRGEGSIKEDLKEIGIASGVGAAIGALIDGGKGALAGLAIGGVGTFLSTKGEQVELPPETPLVIQLNEAIEVPQG